MKPKLLDANSPDGKLREIPLIGDEFLIGRGEDCNLCIYELEVSRHHCLIRFRGGEATAADLGSSNGTYVNGQRVVSQVALRTGDEIKLGNSRYVLDLGDDPDFQFQNANAPDALAATRMLHRTPAPETK